MVLIHLIIFIVICTVYETGPVFADETGKPIKKSNNIVIIRDDLTDNLLKEEPDLKKNIIGKIGMSDNNDYDKINRSMARTTLEKKNNPSLAKTMPKGDDHTVAGTGEQVVARDALDQVNSNYGTIVKYD